MIPQFPHFATINLEHKDVIDNFGHIFGHYSDFNFTSLYCYSIEDKNQVALLNENLVIALQDYNTGKPFLSFLGTVEIRDTVEKLIDYSKNAGWGSILKMIPEVSLPTKETSYEIQEDRDNFDYIYNLEDITNLRGNKFFSHRNLIRRFGKEYPNAEIKSLNLTNQRIMTEINELFDLWLKQTSKPTDENNMEKIAINRLSKVANRIQGLYAVGVYLNNILVAYSIEENLDSDYCIGHFGKANKDYLGLEQFIEHYSAEYMKSMGHKYINLEQDLGMEGLRKHKSLMHPAAFLKKYTIKSP